MDTLQVLLQIFFVVVIDLYELDTFHGVLGRVLTLLPRSCPCWKMVSGYPTNRTCEHNDLMFAGFTQNRDDFL